MASDNVVRPVFGKKKPEQKVLSSAEATLAELRGQEEIDLSDYDIGPLEGDLLVLAQQDLLYMIDNMEYVHGVRNKINDMTDYIFSLRGFSVKDETMKLRREGLRGISFKELCAQVAQGTPLQWKMHPSQYGALTLEYYYRQRNAISLLPKE